MANADSLITDHIDIWTNAIKKRSSQGRGSNKKIELTGIKKLRELILELAVRGQLVPQDPNDEPVSALLKKIAAEKTQLIKDKKIKKTKVLPEIREDKKRFNLPTGWEWCQLGTVIDRISNGFSGKQNKDGYGYPLTRIETISKSSINMDKVGFSPSIPEDKLDYYRLHIGDILLSHINSDYHVAKTALVEGNYEIYHGVNLLLIRLNKHLSPSFINLVINQLRLSGYFLNIAQHAIGQSSINQSKIIEVVSSLPPLSEQHRIVAKVDELMALCDQLEQQTDDSITAHKTLVETLLATLTSSENTQAFNQNWARIAEHFDTLFTTEHSIDQLKQTVLQLAVMGKLVPQNLNDEPASVLLEKIAAEKEQLIKDKKIKKQKVLPAISEDEKPFKLPRGWECLRLGQIINLISGQHLKPEEYFDHQVKDSIAYITGPAEFGEIHPSYSKYTTHQRAVAHKNDILVTCKGSGIGKLNIANEKIAISRQLMAIQTICTSHSYLKLIISSLYKYFQNKGVGIAIPGISREDITEVLIELPPLAEQHRIVKKVDELMTLCDQLKTRISEAQTTQLNLADTLVKQAVT